MKFDIKSIQDGMLAFRGLTRDSIKENNKIYRERYGKEAYYFIMDDLEFVTYGKEVKEDVLSENFKDFFETDHDNEFALEVEKYKPYKNEAFQYRVLTMEDADLVNEFKKQFNETELEYGSVSIEDPLAVGAFDQDKLIAVASMWEWENDLDDIGLIVDTSYRKQGLGTSVVSFIIDQVLDKKICIYRADYDNPGSVKIAKRLGFTQISKIYRYKGK